MSVRLGKGSHSTEFGFASHTAGIEMGLSALIPAYKPDMALVDVVRSLADSALFKSIVVVDDGSGDQYSDRFEAVAAVPGATVLRHAVNLGKGAALKTGMNYLLVKYRGDGCVTADADGQHAPDDVRRVAEKAAQAPDSLVLGARRFEGPVPLRSRIGNTLTKYVFGAVIGRTLIDTQTGLRGVPASLMAPLLAISSNRYEFEMDMLVIAAQRQMAIHEEIIETIYLDGNATSHFNPFFDSLRIYFVILRYAVSSATAWLIDLAAFTVGFFSFHSILAAHIVARLCALPINFYLVRGFVFDARGQITRQFPFYLFVVIVSGVISYFCQIMLIQNFGVAVLAAKIATELVLFFANFLVLRDFVFRRGLTPNGAG